MCLNSHSLLAWMHRTTKGMVLSGTGENPNCLDRDKEVNVALNLCEGSSFRMPSVSLTEFELFSCMSSVRASV